MHAELRRKDSEKIEMEHFRSELERLKRQKDHLEGIVAQRNVESSSVLQRLEDELAETKRFNLRLEKDLSAARMDLIESDKEWEYFKLPSLTAALTDAKTQLMIALETPYFRQMELLNFMSSLAHPLAPGELSLAQGAREMQKAFPSMEADLMGANLNTPRPGSSAAPLLPARPPGVTPAALSSPPESPRGSGADAMGWTKSPGASYLGGLGPVN